MGERSVRIAVDAMGGDHDVHVILAGALAAARTDGLSLAFVGLEAVVEAALAQVDTSGVDVIVIPATQTIDMDDHPAQAVRRKTDASITVGLRAMKDGRADAMMSAGNSGAVMAAALMVLGRIPGVDRPALATTLPTKTGQTLVLDLGAVTDPRPQHLHTFAHMGRVYSQMVLGVAQPRIGLLSNGEEPGKGNQLVQEVYPLLANDPAITFHGNVEGSDITAGTVDVVVTDGFTGNVALKVAEGVSTLVTDLLRTELTATLPRKLAAAMLRPAFRSMRKRLDYREYGGAPLLGVNGAVIIAHGRSDEIAICSAVRVAGQIAQAHVVEEIARTVAQSTLESSSGRTIEPES